MSRGRANWARAPGAAIQEYAGRREPGGLAAPAPGGPDLADFADFVTGSQAKMVRLAELLTGDRDRAED